MTNTLWKGINEEILWSVPIIVNDGSSSLAKAATGAYDGYYRQVAQTLLASRAGDSDPIYVRTGWEANGDWFFWNAIGKEAAFKGAFQHFADAFHGVSNRFKIEWNINYAEGGMDPATIYPGDKYVDVVGMDFYWVLEHQGTDPNTAWSKIQNAKYGLNWLENFAKAHGKPTAYSEWGIESNNAGPYLEKAKAWFDSHNVAYQSYWDYTMGGDVIALSDGTLPTSGAAFKRLFGAGSTTTPVTPPTEPTTGTTPPGVIAGTSAREALNGTSGADTLRGSGGDTMSGGAGDDTYEVNSPADIVVERPGEGVDTVTTWIDGYTLPDNVENLVLTGTGWNTITGNALANRIIGNDAPNVINGRGGNDLLTGGGGNDTFVIARGEGNDTITDFRAGVGAGDVLRLDGFSFADFAALKAAATQSGADLVIRLASDQTLTLRGVQLSSLASDDVSLVNIKAAAPTPVVTAPVATTPTTTGGTAAASVATTNNIWGGTGTDTLNGTDANDRIASVGGSDRMSGGKGDDTYVIYSGTEQVIEKAGEGVDTVETWIGKYALAANVENLVIIGTSWTQGTGNDLANTIVGNSSPNLLDGRGGNDLLTGGRGNDTFVIGKGLGTDTITDFRPHAWGGEADTIQLTGFGSGARLSSAGSLFSVTASDGSVTQFTLNGVTSLGSNDLVWA